MKFFRSHIVRIHGAAILLLAMFLYLSKPVQETTHHDAFTSWLDGRLKTDDDSEVKKRLHDLSNQGTELDDLIRMASKLVANNSDDFELPLDGSDSDEAYQVLLSEWTSYQHAASGMGKAVILESSKAQALPQDGKILYTGTLSVALSQTSPTQEYFLAASQYLTAADLSPMESGIAIGAP